MSSNSSSKGLSALGRHYFILGKGEIDPLQDEVMSLSTHHRTNLSYPAAVQASVSVILCTHNPRPDYLCRVLTSFRGQTLPPEQWEFLLIDNACEQPLAEIWDISWHPYGRHIRENEVGLTAARLRAIQESSGELLVFVDDDNVLAPNFLAQAAAISARCPFLGVFGAGILEPEFEIEPQAKLRPHLHRLALRNTQSALWSNNVKDYQCTPAGAGLCVTRRVANFYREFLEGLGINAVLDRRGKRLFSSGDDLFSRLAAQVGLAFGVSPALRITHLISAHRLHQRYFLRLIHDQSLSAGIMAYVLDGTQPRQTDLVWFVRLLLHGMRNGLCSMRCWWVAARGQDGAAQFISANGLSPGKALAEGAQGTCFPTDLRPSSVIPFYHATLCHEHSAERQESLEST
jgi:glycosyltransferase involved in cell wall biosynthesis